MTPYVVDWEEAGEQESQSTRRLLGRQQTFIARDILESSNWLLRVVTSTDRRNP